MLEILYSLLYDQYKFMCQQSHKKKSDFDIHLLCFWHSPIVFIIVTSICKDYIVKFIMYLTFFYYLIEVTLWNQKMQNRNARTCFERKVTLYLLINLLQVVKWIISYMLYIYTRKTGAKHSAQKELTNYLRFQPIN